MSSRSQLKHLVTSSAPGVGQVGDEYFNPSTNKLFKRLVVNGTTLGYEEVPVLSQVVSITNTTTAISSTTGALTVAGGAGIVGSLFVGGNLTIVGTISGSISTAAAVSGGTAGQLLYQSGASVTAFAGPGTAGQVLTSAGTGAPTYVTTTTLYVGRATTADTVSGSVANISGGILGQIPYQLAANSTAFIGTGTAGTILQMGANTATFVTTASIYVNSAVNAQNLFGGTAGQLHYQSAVGVTAFAGPGTAGQILTSGGTGAPTYVATGSIYTGFADSSNNVRGGILGQIPYQSAANTTLFIGTGTQGSILQMGANTATFVTTANIFVNSAVNAINLFGGTAGQLVYQSGVGVTAFAGPGTAGQVLTSGGTGAPTYVSTTTLYVNRAVTADSATGSAGSVANALTFSDAGTGAASGSTYNGSAARTISYNSIGAPQSGQNFDATNARQVNSFISSDTRNTNFTPGGRTAGLYADFRDNTVGGLSDGGSYHGILTFRSYGLSNTDLTGGQVKQIAYTDNNNLWHRLSTNSSTWGTWFRIIDTNNTGTAYVNRAVIADTINAQARPSASAHFLTFVDSNNAAATAELLYTTSTLVVQPTETGAYLGIGTATPGYLVDMQRSANGIVSAAILNNNAGTSAVTRFLLGNSTNADRAGIQLHGGSYTSGFPNFQDGLYIYSKGTGGTTIQAEGSADVRLATNGTTRIQIDPNGRVGVGLTAPTATLQVSGDVRISGISTITNTTSATSTITGALQVVGGIGVQSNISVGGALVVGAGDTNQMGVRGEIRATNEITAYFSDRRLKENVQVIGDAVTKVLSLHGITYNPNDLAAVFGYDKSKKLVGVFADEIDAVLPEAVRPAPFDIGENGVSISGQNFKTVQYERIVPLLIEAIKEQQTLINKLEKDLQHVKREIESLR